MIADTDLRVRRDGTFTGEFVGYYNHHHRHGGIGLHTPADVHYGLAGVTASQRSAALGEARQWHPTRFATTKDPKILDLPAAAWLKEPTEEGTTAA